MHSNDDSVGGITGVIVTSEAQEYITKKRIINSINGSKGGRPKKENQKETELKPNGNPIKTETKGIREDKIREDKIKPFLVWFNNQKKKHTGTPFIGHFSAFLTPRQLTEFTTSVW